MSVRSGELPGVEAVRKLGWLSAHRWLIARRFSQAVILLLFMAGPWFGVWLIEGNLSSSRVLDTLPLTDPYLLLQSLFAGHMPEQSALVGALIVIAFYLLLSGRVYCSWVCPLNAVTDFAYWLRGRLGLKGGAHIPSATRYWMIGATLLVSLLTGALTFELVNPVSMLHRGLIFGLGTAWVFVLGVFLFDLFGAKRGWCGRLCPVGAFYSLIGRFSLLRIRSDGRSKCDDCMDCYEVCPEPRVIKPALKDTQAEPVVTSSLCTLCGRCMDVCPEKVFHLGSRLSSIVANPPAQPTGLEVMKK